MKTKNIATLIAASAFALSMQSSMAEDFSVQGVGVKFEPAFLIVQPGDSLSFSNMSGHMVETIDSMVPEGQEKVLTNMGEDTSITFNTPGIVVYKCTPHWGARMGGIVLVGDPENPQAIIDQYTASIEEHPENMAAKGLLTKFTAYLQENGKL